MPGLDRTFGDIDEVIAYIGKLASRLNEKLEERNERKLLFTNITKDVVITSENYKELLKDNYLIMVSLEVREPASIGNTPFDSRKNWNIHGLTYEREDAAGNYERTDHIYRYDNMLVFYVFGNSYTEVVSDSMYVQSILDQFSTHVSRHVAERMFFFEYVKNTTGNMDFFGSKVLNEYTNAGMDYLGVGYYVNTRKTLSEYHDLIQNIGGQVNVSKE